MKYVLLTGMLLLNYFIENIQLSYSKKKQHYQVVATSNFMSRKEIVLIDFDINDLFEKGKSIITGSSQTKKNDITHSFYEHSSEVWMMFGALL